MRRYLLSVAAALTAAALTAGISLADHSRGAAHRHHSRSYAIGLWGDLPYNDVQKTTGVPSLIADMNRQRLTFSAHDGDLKAGSTPCTDDVYTTGLSYFNSLRAPAIFTPGDNDWTDCDRGGSNPLERLDRERRLFFNTPYSLGQRRLRQAVQRTPDCLGATGPTPCVENRRWTVGHVTYATLNVQGSCNNLCDVGPNPAEYATRNSANIAWLRKAFEVARHEHSSAVMLISQADPGWDGSDATRAPTRDPKTLVESDGQPDGYHDFLVALRDETTAFGKPVAYVNGDSHYFRIDKPLQNADGQRLENFTRVETFGDHQENGNNDAHWLKVLVNPGSRDVFAYQPQIVPANRTAVPAP